MKYGLKNSTVDSNIYIDISAFFILIYLTIIIVHIIYYTCKKNIEFKNKPILRSIYTLLGITLILILTSIFNIKIPINLIPNKWSNFEQVIEIYKKYIFQFQYFFYSKKYCIGIIRKSWSKTYNFIFHIIISNKTLVLIFWNFLCIE